MNAPIKPSTSMEALQARIRDIQEATRGVTAQYDRAYILQCIKEDRFPDELWAKLGEFGLLGLSIPEEYGGSGGGVLEITALNEALALAGVPTLFLVVTGLGRVPIVRNGTPEQIKKYVTPTCTGEKKMCFAITEPNAGTNSFAMTTLAQPNGKGGWTLNGQKVFISGARDADYMLVVARTTRAAEVKNRTEGMSLFVLDMKTPGIKLQQLNIQVETAERQYMVFFDNVELPADALIGEAGKGAKAMFEGLNSERLLAAGAALGLGDYALAKAVAYSKDRKPFGKPIGSYQALQHRMAMAKAQLEAARLMTYSAAERFDAGEDAGAHANMAKLLGSEAAVAAVEAALQTHGGYGFDRDYDVVTLWPMLRLLKIAPINNEMLLNYIGEHVLGLPKSY
ncbi:acyl-CoA dehydrogenase family protein [Extensimonas vulgaris]|uniref:Acyl-CoA dehydrogenase n=1 Tax=Extensimonas vulgaris TaxID=1031594 RepID=A0A369AJU8_9BURK|nr:acyl-CoA dehydrogenase family protein [Extensimonas vulgaris]RCX09679.1 acyl-CoA dehydrogenase [Extensimonas vulgaris]TWI39309.1 acyl-CoA dehydrogenase [Extensimonas vulgaris]TXD15561.1 acyl-CoA dehydrogenase [Extensimonas vulgaris]